MANFSRKFFKFGFAGLCVSRPPDLLDEYKYQVATNVRSYQQGVIQPRPGLESITAALIAGRVHSIKRLNDPISGTYLPVVGNGTEIAGGTTSGTYSVLDTGYSGDPLTFITHRPSFSPIPWVYVGDSAKMRKIRVDGTNYTVGVFPPNQPPVLQLAQLSYQVISEFESAGDWTPGGDAGVIAASNRVSTTISTILYDRDNESGIFNMTGWADVSVANFTQNIQPGMFLTVNTGGAAEERVLVDAVFNAITDTVIGSIAYDSGSTGLCTIQPSTPTMELQKDMMVFLGSSGGSPGRDEYVRVLSISTGPTGIVSFRCCTTYTHVNTGTGDEVSGIQSFRAYFSKNHAAAETLITKMITDTVTFSSGIGTITRVANYNLSQVPTDPFAPSGAQRPIQQDDKIHLSVWVSDISLLTEVQVILDVDSTTAAVGDVGTKNYYYFALQPNAFADNTIQTSTLLTAQQRALQRGSITDLSSGVTPPDASPRRPFLLDDGGGGSGDDGPYSAVFDVVQPPLGGAGVTVAGSGQWTELIFSVGDLLRVGSDTSRNLANVKGLRVTFVCTGTINVQLDALWIGGTFGPDVGQVGNPYIYRYRGRSKTTGARSRPSPATRSGISPVRQGVDVVLTTYDTTSSGDPQVEVLDIERFGGSLNVWRKVGTIDNPQNAASTTVTFTDVYPDDAIAANDSLDLDVFKPFPVVSTPLSGTCNVVGTVVTGTAGDSFPTNLSDGNLIVINGAAFTTYARPTATVLQIVENAGNLTGVQWEITNPLLIGVPLPIIIGPFGAGLTGLYYFGIGDPKNPGTLRWTNANNPDGASDRNYLEITSPSEPLLNGVIYDARLYVWSSENMFQVVPNPSAGEFGATDFIAIPIPNGKGLFAQWAVAVGPKMWWVGEDGIYESVGGEPANLTDADLFPLFPHDGVAGVETNGYAPPDYNYPEFFALDYEDSFLRFTYQDTLGNQRTLIRYLPTGAWSVDAYQQSGATKFYQEEGAGVHSVLAGTVASGIFSVAGETDNGTSFIAQLTTRYEDQGDPRATKIYGDLVVDADTDGVVTALLCKFDNGASGFLLNPLTTSSRELTVREIASGIGQTARNFALQLTVSSADGTTPQYYGWEPSYIPKPEVTGLRALDWTDCGYPGAKWIQGFRIHCDTSGETRNVEIQYYDEAGDLQTASPTFSINQPTESIVGYAFSTPIITHMVRMLPIDSQEWRVFDVVYDFVPEPELTTHWIPQPTSFGMKGFLHIRECWITLRSTDNVTLTITPDNGDPIAAQTFTIPSTDGEVQKVYIPVQAGVAGGLKGKIFQPQLVGATGFRVYMNDIECRIKEWGSDSPYQIVRPFGENASTPQARI